ncbi:MAG: aminodeoxychorismate synthase component I [Fibrobacterota bacterium]
MTPDGILIKSFPFPQSLYSLAVSSLDESGASLLDSSDTLSPLGHYSFFGRAPFATFSSDGHADPLATLKKALALFSAPRQLSPLPFTGGAIGSFSYDLGRRLERLPEKARPLLGFPDVHLCFYDAIAVYDHAEAMLHLCASDPRTEGMAALQKKMDGLEAWAEAAAKESAPESETGAPLGKNLCSNFTRSAYCRAVEQVQEHIVAGDIYQANLSQAFSFDLNCTPEALYAHLRARTPAPFSAFINYGGRVIASCSPERFLQLRNGLAETRPIKGTRPRGKDAAEDAAHRHELFASRKDRAELTMIVDLERNDLGRVAEYGSVVVAEPPALESYADVHHLAATVRARLKPGCGAVDLLRASFPGGSITGAPKIRAMEIIESLEPTRRSLYTGALGYIGFNGDMDLNIVIRTVLCEGTRAVFQAGGGIVADSDPELEYEETLHKVRGILRVIHGTGEEALHGGRMA